MGVLEEEINLAGDCSCGSGARFGDCCGLRLFHDDGDRRLLPQMISGEIAEYRMRAIHDRIVFRPKDEHLHAFLLNDLRYVFGEEWWADQTNRDADTRHAVMRWTNSIEGWKRQNPAGLGPNDLVRGRATLQKYCHLQQICITCNWLISCPHHWSIDCAPWINFRERVTN